MKRIHYLLLGLALSLTIAAVAPSLPPTRIIASTNITVVTNGVNNFTLSASGGLSALNQNQFDSSSTNIKSGALVTNLNVKASSGNALTVNTNALVVDTNNVSMAGNLTVTGTVTGNGSGVTNLPVYLIAGSNITLTTNSVNNWTVAAVGPTGAPMNTNQFDTTYTNIKTSPLVTNLLAYPHSTTNDSMRFYATNGAERVAINRYGNIIGRGGNVLNFVTPDGNPVFKFQYAFGEGAGDIRHAYDIYNGIFCFNTGSTIGWGNPSTPSLDTSLRRNAANTIEFDSGTTGVANRGTLLAAKYTGRAGTSTTTFNAGGMIVVDTTQTGNSGTNTTTLQTNSIGASTLAANGDMLVVEADGTFANTGDNKTIVLNYGTTAILSLPASSYGFNGATTWRIRAKIIRTGAATQKSSAEIILGNTDGVLPYTFYTTPTNTLSGAVGLWLTGAGGNNNDIVKEMYSVEFKPAP